MYSKMIFRAAQFLFNKKTFEIYETEDKDLYWK